METSTSDLSHLVDRLLMNVDDTTLSRNEIRLLSSVGFLAAKAGCLVPAVRIFESLAVLRPGQAFPFIGMAIAYLAVGMAGEAVKILRDRAIPSCPDVAGLGLWLSFALQQAGDHAAAKRELGEASRSLSSEDLPSLARILAILLGARPEIPDWPTPAPLIDYDTDSAIGESYREDFKLPTKHRVTP